MGDGITKTQQFPAWFDWCDKGTIVNCKLFQRCFHRPGEIDANFLFPRSQRKPLGKITKWELKLGIIANQLGLREIVKRADPLAIHKHFKGKIFSGASEGGIYAQKDGLTIGAKAHLDAGGGKRFHIKIAAAIFI